MSQTQTQSILLRGGMNLVTPAIAIPPGQVIACDGYEADVSGYTRLGGHERLDGRPKPSAASYWVLNFDAGTAAISDGDTVTGASSSATGIAVIDAVVETGAYGTSDAAGYLVLSEVSGTFTDDENLQVSAVTKCVANGTATERGADNDTNDATWLQASIEERRALIQKPAGSGAIRGVWTFDGDIYCVRDNAGATAGVIHKATTSGWAAQSLGHIIEFTSSSGQFTEGEVVSGGTSGATGTIARMALLDSTWTSGEGYLVLTGVTGTFQAETITGADSSETATCGGAQTEITLPVGGKYRVAKHNFFGASNFKRVYFANGVGRAHEYNGTVAAPIRTGVADSLDKPTHIAVHQQHLFLGYQGGSLQHSEPGEPLQYQTTSGAGEIGFGSDFAGLIQNFATALIVIGTDKTGYLSGTSSQDFLLSDLSDEAGGKLATAQNIGGVIYQDEQGIRRISATQAFGNFRTGTVSGPIEPLFRAKKKNGVSPVASLRVRGRDIYRIFYDDKSVISVYLGRRQPECMAFSYPFQANVLHSGEDASGGEILLAGTDDGWVLQLDAGTSFDGEEINAYVQMPFLSLGSSTLDKCFYKATLDVIGTEQATLSITADYGYGNPNLIPSAEQDFDVSMGGGFWNVDTWNQFIWSAQVVGQADAFIDGYGPNISVAIRSDATYEPQHTLSTLTIYFNNRGLVRS